MIDYSIIPLRVWIDVISFIVFLFFLANMTISNEKKENKEKSYDLSQWQKRS